MGQPWPHESGSPPPVSSFSQQPPQSPPPTARALIADFSGIYESPFGIFDDRGIRDARLISKQASGVQAGLRWAG